MLNLLGNRILVAMDKSHEQTAGGIYIPEKLQAERNSGLIILIGDACDRKFEHRKIIYTKNTGEKMFYEGMECILLYSFDVIALLD